MKRILLLLLFILCGCSTIPTSTKMQRVFWGIESTSQRNNWKELMRIMRDEHVFGVHVLYELRDRDGMWVLFFKEVQRDEGTTL